MLSGKSVDVQTGGNLSGTLGYVSVSGKVIEKEHETK
jgi:hypothetical protein